MTPPGTAQPGGVAVQKFFGQGFDNVRWAGYGSYISKTDRPKGAEMNAITITAAELLPGDDNDGDVIATVDVRDAKVFLTYEGDDTRIRVAAGQVFTVLRAGGVSTVAAPVAPAAKERIDYLAADKLAGVERERNLRNDLRRERRLYT